MKPAIYRAFRRCLSGLMLAVCLLFVWACDDTDASNMSITLREDRSGTIQTTRLAIPDDAATSQPPAAGITWEASARVVTSKGSFASLDGVTFEDVSFDLETTSKGLNVLRVTLPRGPEAKWVHALTQPSAQRRRETTAAIFPEQKESRLGSVIALSLTLPTPPISAGVAPVASGIASSVEKNIVTLTVRVDAALKPGNEIVWDITWGIPKR